ncbi:MAG: homocysteine S-methyltransferase [Rhodobacteraceae bacterium]|nr:homocysteine S-methyltransferase [Paracoccaceae bacterium]
MDITLLDGGMGQELLARTGDEPTPLWATQVMLDHPDVVRAIHADYFAAGATVATTNTYAIHHDRLERFDVDHLFEVLHMKAISQAEEARAAHGGGRIAGSLGPLVATYRPETCPPVAEAQPKYAEIAQLLGPHVDLFLCETMSSVMQAEGALAGAAEGGKPVWLSVTVDDRDGTRLRSGEPLADLAPLIDRYRPTAILCNCSVPEAMADAMAEVAKFGLPFGAYANGFTHISDAFKQDSPTVAALEARHDLTPDRYAAFAMGWVDQGATIVGGCCEVGPAHIRALADALTAAGYRIV